ncbi:MAG: hypothetical protein K0R48_416 [Gammaproteobacteria bacterium]|jgi:SAM-dependent methyltransferase|nr:hypothetical protein [Gammaproteobacteria bacterium]
MNPLWKNTPDKIGQLIPTLNEQGFMTTVLDPYTNAFIRSLCGSKDPVLEIGTAYGIATLAMLNNNIHVIANDLEVKHLDILKDNVPKELSHLIEYCSGDFRDLTIANNSLAGILTVRVLHFFSGDIIEKSLHQFYQWLKPGGQLCLVVDTPYLKHLSKLIPLFEKRLAQGKDWPGHFDNYKGYLDAKYIDKLPDFMNLQSPETLQRATEKQGFKVKELGFCARPDYPDDVRLDGRENIGIICMKPNPLS